MQGGNLQKKWLSFNKSIKELDSHGRLDSRGNNHPQILLTKGKIQVGVVLMCVYVRRVG